MDASLFMRPSGQTLVLPSFTPSKPSPGPTEPSAKKRRKSAKGDRDSSPQAVDSRHNIDGPMIHGDVDLVGTEVLIRSKIMAAKAFGKLMSIWPAASRSATFSPPVITELQSPSSSTRVAAAMVVEEYARNSLELDEFGQSVTASLRSLVEEDSSAYYADIKPYLATLHHQCKYILNVFESAKLDSKQFPHLGGTLQVLSLIHI